MPKLSVSTVESLVLLALSALGVVQSIDLIIHPDPVALYDEVGPGRFVLVASLLLLIAAAVHLLRARRRPPAGAPAASGPARQGVVRTTGSLIVCVALMDLLGFVPATLLFLFLLFTFSGQRSWLRNALLAIVYVAVIYVVFVQVFNMELPRGWIAERWLTSSVEAPHGPA